MSVKRFEEQVRESMEELKFSPSENVWAGVVSELDKRRKRRVALWWIPIGILLVGSVYFWNQSQVGESNTIAQNENTQKVKVDNNVSGDDNANNQITEEDVDQVNEEIPSNKIRKPEGENIAGKNSDANNANRLIADADKKGSNSNGTLDENIQRVKKENSSSQNLRTNSPSHNVRSNSSFQNGRTNSSDKLSSTSTRRINSNDYENINPILSEKSKTVSRNNFELNPIGSVNELDNKTGSSVLENKDENFPESSSINFYPQSTLSPGEIKSTLPLKDYKISTAAPAKSIIRNWSYGLNVAAGVAGIYDRNLIRQTDATSRNSLAFLPANSSSIVYRTAVVEPGAFYAIGGFIEKPIGRLFNLSAGLNYTRYNSKVNVGSKISRSTTIFPGTQDNQDIPFYYSPDPKGSYQMHHSMIEIPVTLRVTYKSVSANAGVTGSTLVSSDMLAFDARSGVYYKEKDKLNRFQFGLTGGFDVAVLKKAKYPLYIGPVFRYQVSDITSRYSDSRHLISAALQARFYLQR